MKINSETRLFGESLLMTLIILGLSILVLCSSCATTQSPLREKDAKKHYKQRQRDLNYQF